MKTFKLLSLLVLGLLFSHCGTTEPSMNSGIGNSVLQVTQILDTVQGKFYELAQSHLTSTPQEVLVMTADWAKSQPNVASATWFDSSYIDITMKSGLRSTYAIYMYGSDSLSLTRGGPRDAVGGVFTPTLKANHAITNKSVLIYSPFVGREFGSLYSDGEILPLVNKIRNSGKGVSVKLLEANECTVGAIETFKDYGIVIINTHGFPDGFFSGHRVGGLSLQYDTNDAAIKQTLEYTFPDGYNKVLQGYFRFSKVENIGYIIDWQKYLKQKTDNPDTYRLLVNSEFINSLPSMSNTIIVGNMCYSGWSRAGLFEDRFRGTIEYKLPIKTAFTNKKPIAYYSYGFTNELSAPVDNAFAKKMEDTLLRSLIIDGDSTGNAYLNTSNQQFTAGELGDHVSPLMPFILYGANDYSFDDCVNVFTDERDGTIYKAVCIGKQVWMAENLRYNAAGSDVNPNVDLQRYGRFYDHQTVMNGESASNANPSGVRGICPKGWHLPSLAEWRVLGNFLGGDAVAGGPLKATTDWNSPNTGATDKYGFTALPGGLFYADSSVYYFTGNEGNWWATNDGSLTTQHSGMALVNYGTTFIWGTDSNPDPGNKKNCRCLKD